MSIFIAVLDIYNLIRGTRRNILLYFLIYHYSEAKESSYALLKSAVASL